MDRDLHFSSIPSSCFSWTLAKKSPVTTRDAAESWSSSIYKHSDSNIDRRTDNSSVCSSISESVMAQHRWRTGTEYCFTSFTASFHHHITRDLISRNRDNAGLDLKRNYFSLDRSEYTDGVRYLKHNRLVLVTSTKDLKAIRILCKVESLIALVKLNRSLAEAGFSMWRHLEQKWPNCPGACACFENHRQYVNSSSPL